jgi:hypothetical protein
MQVMLYVWVSWMSLNWKVIPRSAMISSLMNMVVSTDHTRCLSRDYVKTTTAFIKQVMKGWITEKTLGIYLKVHTTCLDYPMWLLKRLYNNASHTTKVAYKRSLWLSQLVKQVKHGFYTWYLSLLVVLCPLQQDVIIKWGHKCSWLVLQYIYTALSLLVRTRSLWLV